MSLTDAAGRNSSEFRYLAEICKEHDIQWTDPEVRRERVDVGRRYLSALVWGRGTPQMVLLHGGAQNAHTWDTVALALHRPLVALDLPGHGHSSWWDDHSYPVSDMSSDVTAAVEMLAPDAHVIVGVGLGASVGLIVASLLGDQIRKLVFVDAVPGLGHKVAARPPSVAADSVASFTSVLRFSDFDQLFERARRYSPGRSDAALRRGLEHNAVQSQDGSWSWRWDPGHRNRTDYEPEALKLALDAYQGSILVVAGGASDVVRPEATAELADRHAAVVTVSIPGAEHGVQGTHPLSLAEVVQSFMDG